jgi:hypothetical protein
MGWKKSLDNYLTGDPEDDGFDAYCESVIDSIPDEFYNQNEEWIYSDEATALFLNLFNEGHSIKSAVKLIQIHNK